MEQASKFNEQNNEKDQIIKKMSSTLNQMQDQLKSLWQIPKSFEEVRNQNDVLFYENLDLKKKNFDLENEISNLKIRKDKVDLDKVKHYLQKAEETVSQLESVSINKQINQDMNNLYNQRGKPPTQQLRDALEILKENKSDLHKLLYSIINNKKPFTRFISIAEYFGVKINHHQEVKGKLREKIDS